VRTVVRRLGDLALEAWLPVTLALVWWFTSEHSTTIFFPPLSKILQDFRQTWLFAHARSDLVPSLWRFLLGFVLAIVFGVSIGLLLGLQPLARRLALPTVDFLRAVPITTLAPAFVILLGFSDEMKFAFIAYAAFFPILLNTIDGVRGVDDLQRDMGRVYKVRRRDAIFRIVLPAASPQIFVGLRVALAVGLLAMAFGEMVGGINGVGYFILFSQNTFQIPGMWSGIIVLGIIGYLVNLAFVAVERRVLAWHRGWRASLLGTT
jgi:ABC-type nitrate/sulfonate/bicarbonate transport system permease component